MRRRRRERDGPNATATALGRRSCRGRRCAQSGLGQIGGVREAGGLAGDDSDSGAAIPPARHLLDPAVVETGRRRPLVFGVHLRELGSAADGTGKDSLQDITFDHLVEPTFTG